jgi:hypothetical protein
MAKFEREVDPDNSLPPAERAKRAEHLRKAYFQRLALKSARSRRLAKEKRAEARDLQDVADAADAALGAMGDYDRLQLALAKTLPPENASE